MARLERYAQWLVDNQDKKGTSEFQTVAQAYKALRTSAVQEPAEAPERDAPTPTMLGQVREFGKGIIPGAVGLVESAAIGASALLPEDMEASARERIESVAGAAKRPFAAREGYEDTVGRKFGQALGSTLPFLVTGAAGLAGRGAALGLGVGAGAGEARTRAEEFGATDEQRGTATALGTIPGALEVFAPFRILSRVPDAAKARGVELVKRAAIAGGEEAAQEAASGWAQNLIAQRIYNPEQELIEGLGEEAAYGGAVGALVQGVMDLALGRRARGTQEADARRSALEDSVLAQEQEQERRAAQREMRGERPAEPETDLFGEPVTRTPAARPELGDLYADRMALQEQIAALDPDADPTALLEQLTDLENRIGEIGARPDRAQMGLDLEGGRAYEDLVLERARLEQGPQTPEVARRIGEINRRSQEMLRQGVVDRRKASRSAFSQPDQQVEMRETLDTEAAPGARQQVRQPEVELDPSLRQAISAGIPTMQMPLMFDRTQQEMTVPEGAITLEDLQGIGVPMRTSREWFEANVVGKTPEQVQALVDADPKLVQGKGDRAKVLREILAPKVPEFQEATDARTDVRPEPEADGQPTEPSVGLPDAGVGAEPGPIDAPAARVEPSDGTGVVPSEPDVSAEPVSEVTPTPTLTEQEQAFDELARSVQDESSPAHTDALQILDRNQNNPAFVREYDSAVRRLRGTPTGQPAPAPLPEAQRGMPGRRAPTTPVDPEQFEPVGAVPGGGTARGRQQMIEPMSDADARKMLAARQARSLRESREQRETTPETAERDPRQMELDLGDTPQAQRTELVGTANAALTDAVEAGDPRAALQVIADGTSFSPLDREIAKRLLRARTMPTVVVNPTIDAPAQYNSITDTVEIREIDSHTVLHELVHANTHRLIMRVQNGEATNYGVTRLDNLFSYVRRTAPKLADKYGMTSLTEFAAEVMSNPAFQYELSKIPYQRANAFTEFARSILRMLGISNTSSNTALAEAIISVDAALTDGRTVQDLRLGLGDATVPTVVQVKRDMEQAMQPATDFTRIVQSSEAYRGQPGPLQRATRELADAFSGDQGVDFVTKIRTKIVDDAATVESRLNALFEGGVRSAKGIMNPMGLLRQAQDNGKLLTTWAEFGALIYDPTLGQYYSGEKDGVPSTKEILADLQALADKQGVAFDTAYANVSKMLEARRLDALRKSNKEKGTEFPINKLSNKDPRSANEQIDVALREYDRTPEAAAIQKKLDAARFDLIDNMVRVGRLSKEEGKAWKEASDYVPFDRIDDFSIKFSADKRSGTGLAQLGKLPELVGSGTREVGNVFDNFVKTSGWMIGQTLQQDATSKTLRMLEKLGQAEYMGKVSPSSLPASTRSLMVGTYRNGEQVYYKLPTPYDVLAFKDMREPKGFFIRAFSGFANVLRRTITSLPPFAVRQVVNDIQRAFVTSGVESPSQLILPALRNFVSISAAEIMGKRHPSVQEFGKKGIVGDYDFNTRNPMDSIIQDLGFRSRGPVRGLLHRLDSITRASDLAVRKAIHDQTLKESGDQLLANTRAREFINFRRRGASSMMPALTTTIPFFNAFLQGMDVVYRAATGKGASASVSKGQAQRLFYSKIGTMVAFTAMYSMLMSGEDEYDEMSLRIRSNNWILPGGFKLSVPEELAAIFKVPTEMAMEYFRRSGTPEEMEAAEATITALKYAMEQYGGRMMPVPAAIKPVIEAMTNFSFFTGQQLEGTFQKQLLPTERTRASTSELAKAVSKFSGTIVGEENAVSPIMVDNFLQGYFGSVAGMVTMATDQAMNPNRMDRPLQKYWMLSNFLYDPVGTRRLDELYEARDDVAPILNTLNEIAKTDPERAVEFAERNYEKLALAQSVNLTIRRLSDTRQYKNYLNSDAAAADMTQEERKEAMKEIRTVEVEMARWLREARVELRKMNKQPDR